VHDLLARCDGFRQPARIAELAAVCEADKRGRLGLEEQAYPQAAELLRLLEVARGVGTSQLDLARLSGPAVGEALRKARIAAIGAARAQAAAG
jgi:tRNA nucleotidyltransferase (CCA-adding enzyme)